ncbi:Fic family protein [Pontivivens ytuae]|uniref:Fic family protein n=1 Tax=Pontivivens ytuae TaxID=2789856 RepID=A0A7S9LVI7_9RHOB|nr:Fic family protein [Pontivivens ytuae]
MPGRCIASVRLNDRLVVIHPFTNDNGRTMRLVADLLVTRLGGGPLTWGRQNLTDVSTTRARDGPPSSPPPEAVCSGASPFPWPSACRNHGGLIPPTTL